MATKRIVFVNEDARQCAIRLGICQDIETIGRLMETVLNDEARLGFPVNEMSSLPDSLEPRFTVGFSESDWLYDHVGEVDDILLTVSMAFLNQGVKVDVTFDPDDTEKGYTQRYSFTRWIKGHWSASEDRRYKK